MRAERGPGTCVHKHVAHRHLRYDSPEEAQRASHWAQGPKLASGRRGESSGGRTVDPQVLTTFFSLFCTFPKKCKSLVAGAGRSEP